MQGVVRGRAGRARAAAPRRSRRGSPDAADVAVVNTCCVTHEAVSKSRQAVSRAARAHGRVYVTGCAANLAGALRGSRAERPRPRPAERGRSRAVAGDVGAIGCVQAERTPGADARVREDPGRLLVLVRVLRHPARPRRHAQPPAPSRARRDPAARRAGPSRDRAHGREPRLLPRSRGRLHAARGSSAKRARCPASSAFACRPSR